MQISKLGVSNLTDSVTFKQLKNVLQKDGQQVVNMLGNDFSSEQLAVIASHAGYTSNVIDNALSEDYFGGILSKQALEAKFEAFKANSHVSGLMKDFVGQVKQVISGDFNSKRSKQDFTNNAAMIGAFIGMINSIETKGLDSKYAAMQEFGNLLNKMLTEVSNTEPQVAQTAEASSGQTAQRQIGHRVSPFLPLLILVVAVTACGGDNNGGKTNNATPAPTATQTHFQQRGDLVGWLQDILASSNDCPSVVDNQDPATVAKCGAK